MNEKILNKRKVLRIKRKLRVRSVCRNGNATRPRVSIFRSNKYFYAQAINDELGHTIASIDGRKLGYGNNKEDSQKIGLEFARLLKERGIEHIRFDRNGYLYHGVVASFVDGLRSVGIKL